MSQVRRLLYFPNYLGYLGKTATKTYSTAKVKRDIKPREAVTNNIPSLFPEKFLSKKLKTPENLYLADEKTAQTIDEAIKPFLNTITCDTALEINPGACYFTKRLLDREDEFRKIILLETLEHFMPKLNELHSLYPERVKVKQGDLIGLWKLAFQDRQDKGTRVADLLEDVPRNEPNSTTTNMTLFGAVGSYNFFKHLINSIVFQNSILSLGHCEMFLVVPPPIFIHLTCSNEIGYMIYRSTSILFQMLFEYRFIARVPRESYLPPEVKFNPSKFSKLLRVKSINPEYLYLIKITPRQDIHKLCPPTDLTALWYFVKQNCISRRNRVIPNLEKWITGCGSRLIVNKKKRIPVKKLFKDENSKRLPQYSKPCTTMSNQDFFPNMNIYTQFGDLTPSQILTVFTEFRQWPEYTESSFLASLENSLLKLETSEDDSIDGVGLKEEDDEYIKETVTVEETQKSTNKRKKKED